MDTTTGRAATTQAQFQGRGAKRDLRVALVAWAGSAVKVDRRKPFAELKATYQAAHSKIIALAAAVSANWLLVRSLLFPRWAAVRPAPEPLVPDALAGMRAKRDARRTTSPALRVGPTRLRPASSWPSVSPARVATDALAAGDAGSRSAGGSGPAARTRLLSDSPPVPLRRVLVSYWQD